MWGSFFGWGDQTFVSPFWYANFYNDNIDATARLELPPADSATGAAPYSGWILVPGPLPKVVSTTPAAGASGMPRSVAVRVAFNDVMDPATINAGSFTLSGVAGSVSYDQASNSATFTPAAPLAAATSYTAAISSDARDLAGNPLAAKSWSFTTAFGAPSFPDGILIPGGAETSVADALAALRIAVHLVSASAGDLAHGDVAPLGPDGLPRPDGKIELQDALVLLRKAVRLIAW